MLRSLEESGRKAEVSVGSSGNLGPPQNPRALYRLCSGARLRPSGVYIAWTGNSWDNCQSSVFVSDPVGIPHLTLVAQAALWGAEKECHKGKASRGSLGSAPLAGVLDPVGLLGVAGKLWVSRHLKSRRTGGSRPEAVHSRALEPQIHVTGDSQSDRPILLVS